VLEHGKLPLERVLGFEVAEVWADVHRHHRIDLRVETQVEGFRGDGRVEAVSLAGGEEIPADLVVVGIGVAPRTELAERAGIEVNNGIVVDQRLETSAPGVFAAGDVANAYHPFLGRRIRVEHWANALHQPEVAARAMLGKDASYDRLPYFFTDQYDVGMEYAGYATDWDEVVFRGDPESREFIAFWLKGGIVVAGMNVNVWDVTDDIQALIHARRPVHVDRLREPDVPLGDLVGETVG
jgi:3-phenylpropionate/trans-cinnamate dioxygenase ferredoxin reductase subunit